MRSWGEGLPIKLLLDWRPIGTSLLDRTYTHEIVSRSGFPSYVGISTFLRSSTYSVAALSMLRGTFKIRSIFKVCRVWFLHTYVDFGGKSTCAMQDRRNLCVLVPPSHGCGSWVMRWIFPGYHLAVIRSGYRLAVVQSDLVRYSVARFRYKLVSCTLSRLCHESVGGTGIRPMTVMSLCLQKQSLLHWTLVIVSPNHLSCVKYWMRIEMWMFHFAS